MIHNNLQMKSEQYHHLSLILKITLTTLIIDYLTQDFISEFRILAS